MALSRDELEALALTDVQTPIAVPSLMAAMTAPPFIPTHSIVNLRDVGLVPDSPIKPGLVFRSGTLEQAKKDPDALAWLGSGKLKRIFDLRQPMERQLSPEVEIAAVEATWFDSTDPDGRPDLPSFVEGGGEKGVEKEYLKVLSIYKPTFKSVLEHVRDRPGEPFLFHCSAGRDRTGVLAGLLMALAGGSPDAVRFDYMLSRIGTEPAREMLLQYAIMGTGVTSMEEPGFLNLVSLRPSCWDAFVAAVDREYGGWEGYVTGQLGFTPQDVLAIRKNLTAE